MAMSPLHSTANFQQLSNDAKPQMNPSSILQDICGGALSIMSASRREGATARTLAGVPQLLAVLTPTPALLLATRSRDVVQEGIVAARAVVVHAAAGAEAVGLVLREAQAVALLAPAPAGLNIGSRALWRKRELVVAAAHADVRAAGRARRLAVIAEQLTVLAPAPLVLTDLGLRARLAVPAQDVRAALREVMMAAAHAILLLAILVGQALALEAPPVRDNQMS